MSRNLRQQVTEERGAILVAGLLLTLALLLVIGTAVDIGNAFIIRRQLASLADQAALSGSQAIDFNALHNGRVALDPQQAQQAALQTIAAEPGVRAQAQASTGAVRVDVTRQVPTVLLRLVGLSRLTVAATATAAPQTP